MTKISCTFVKCKYNDYGKLGICQNEYIQMGGHVDPEDTLRKTIPACADFKEKQTGGQEKKATRPGPGLYSLNVDVNLNTSCNTCKHFIPRWGGNVTSNSQPAWCLKDGVILTKEKILKACNQGEKK